jgi:hypothetical protein
MIAIAVILLLTVGLGPVDGRWSIEGALEAQGEDLEDISDGGTPEPPPSHPPLQPLPPYWTRVKALTSDHFPVDSDGALVVDAWDYLQRMALYKHLIEHVDHCLWSTSDEGGGGSGGSSDRDLYPGNIIWGLALQHGWQQGSSRLMDPMVTAAAAAATASNGTSASANTYTHAHAHPDEASDTTISPSSWWACMNYYLSVLPYLGAVEAGLAPRVALLSNPDPTRFCTDTEEDWCRELVRPWTQFFLSVKASATACDEVPVPVPVPLPLPLPRAEAHFPIADGTEFTLPAGMESLLQELWAAHLHSINAAKPRFQDELALYPGTEQRFCRSWASLVRKYTPADSHDFHSHPSLTHTPPHLYTHICPRPHSRLCHYIQRSRLRCTTLHCTATLLG